MNTHKQVVPRFCSWCGKPVKQTTKPYLHCAICGDVTDSAKLHAVGKEMPPQSTVEPKIRPPRGVIETHNLKQDGFGCP